MCLLYGGSTVYGIWLHLLRNAKTDIGIYNHHSMAGTVWVFKLTLRGTLSHILHNYYLEIISINAFHLRVVRHGYHAASKKCDHELLRVRELLRQACRKAGLKAELYSPHSLRTGGATAAANNGVPDRAFKRHGRWKTARKMHKVLVIKC